ncbi:MAG: pYEATS domain-containing protein [Vicinamibacterales bacterium]
MNALEPLPDDLDEAGRFRSFAAMRLSHTALLRLYRAMGASPELLERAQAFVRSGAATGAILQSEDERLASQSLLDYWAAVLSRAEHQIGDALLADFEPELVPELPDALCPYVGLESFSESHHQLFFGRDRLLREMTSQLQTTGFLAVIGALGSGKSSLVLGGLIPALKAGAIDGSVAWRYCPVVVPGSDPIGNLARALEVPESPPTPAGIVRHLDAGDQPGVIVVDRLEELFWVCGSTDRRDAFGEALFGLVTSSGKHRVVVILRSDFEAQVAAVPKLDELFSRSPFRIPPLTPAELRDAILAPAERVGLKFEEGLVDRLVKEILGEPAGLPLLQFTLLKLWKLRERNTITMEAYRQIGGARRALAQAADRMFESLSAGDQATLKTILLTMARPAAGREVVSNSVTVAELSEKADRASVLRVVQELIDARLVRIVSGGEPEQRRLEFAHEALLSNWPRLAEWLDEERVSTRRRVRLTTAAEQWMAHGRDPGGLLGGSLLEEARGYVDLTPFEREFVEASLAAEDSAAAEKERLRQRELQQVQLLAEEQKQRADEQAMAAAQLAAKNRYLRMLSALVGVLLLIAATGWLFAERARRDADRKRQTVEALISGQGVVVEKRDGGPAPISEGPAGSGAPPPTVASQPSDSAAAPAASSPGGSPAGLSTPPPANPTMSAASASMSAGNASASLALPGPSAAAALPSLPPGSAAAAAIGSVPYTPLSAVRSQPAVLSQLQLRADRRPLGRLIQGTELPAYNFSAWVEGPEDVLAQIESVQYEFNHPTFQQKVQVGRERSRGFRVGYTGWGCLSSVAVSVKLRDATVPMPHIDFNMCDAIASEAASRKR